MPISYALDVSGARGDAGAAARPRRRAHARVRGARRRGVPAARARRARPASAAARSRAPTTPRTRSPWRRSWTGGSPFLDIAETVERALGERRRRAGPRPRRPARGRRRARAGSPKGRWRPHELLRRHRRARAPDLRPRARPLLRLAAVGMRPRRFYIGFPPALVEDDAERDRVRHRRDPARRLREDPGMHRPAPSDVDTHFAPAVAEAPELAGPLDRLRRSWPQDDLDAARAALDGAARSGGRARAVAARPREAATKGLTELGDALGPDAYWRAPTWKRIAAIAAGPGANIVLALVLFTVLLHAGPYRRHSDDDDGPRRRRRRVWPGRPPQAAPGSSPATASSPVNGEPVDRADRDARSTHRSSGSSATGRPSTSPRSRRRARRCTTGSASCSGGRARTCSAAVVAAASRHRARHEGDRRLARPARHRRRAATRSRARSGSSRARPRRPSGAPTTSSGCSALISLSLALLNLLPLLPLDGGHIAFALSRASAAARSAARGLRAGRASGSLRPAALLHRPVERHRPALDRTGYPRARWPREVQIRVGDVAIGGGAPVVVQSMTLTPTHDVEATVGADRRARLRRLRGRARARCRRPRTPRRCTKIVRLSPLPGDRRHPLQRVASR